MIRNHFKLILRNLWKNKVVSFINLTGLTLGIGCSLLLLMYVQYENGFDDFMEDGDRMYRLGLQELGANARKIGLSGWGDVEDLSSNYAGVTEVLHMNNNGYDLARADDPEKRIDLEATFSSENFFDFFDFPVVSGDAESILSDPSSIVLTPTVAESLFGDENPVGQTVRLIASSFEKDLVVAGLAESPANSHIRFQAVIPWSMRSPDGRHIAQMWFRQSLYAYIKTASPNQIEEVTQKKNESLKAQGAEDQYAYFFQPLSEIYMGSNDIQFLDFESGNAQTVQTLFYIAIIILLVACINYVNLQTAKGTRRSKEVGVRKVMGAKKGQLVRQFLVESVVLTLMASVLAVLLIDLILPVFNGLTGKEFSTTLLIDNGLALFLLVIALATALIAGLYPAFVLSAFKPTDVLKSSVHGRLAGAKARSTLMLLQFGISIFLMAVTYITYQQTAFINHKDLGFNKEQVITFSIATKNMYTSREAFRQELNNHPGVVATSLSTDILGSGYTNNSGPVYSKVNPDMKASTTVFGTDHYFVDAYDMELVAGRNFDPQSSSDSNAVIVNEALVRALALEDPLNSRVAMWNPASEGVSIIGVVKDFHFQKLHQEINPVMIRIAPRNIWNLSVQLAEDNITETLAFIEEKWSEFEPETALSYRFVDQRFARFYEEEVRMQKAITFFAMVSIVLTALGLFGMTTFVIERKVKEIGIRKVLGASVSSINLMIYKEFGLVFLLSLLIAIPSAYYLGNGWLDKFAYRIDISAIPFVVASILTMLVVMGTVSLLSIRAANANPVTALRNE